MEGILLKSYLCPVRKGSVRIIVTVKGLVLLNALNIIHIKSFKDKTDTVRVRTTDNPDLQYNLHLLSPTFSFKHIIRYNTCFKVKVDNAVIEICVISSRCGTVTGRPAVLKHNHTT